MILLLDIGNTRIKWARLEHGALSQQSAIPHANLSTDSFATAVLGTGAHAERVLIGNVNGPRMGDLVRAAIVREWSIEPEFIVSTAAAGGVRNAYPDPRKLGVDRWLAVIAAHAMKQGAACIASVGTAMTIDGVDANGRHLGGVIVPGPDLMVSSLLHNTSDIARHAEQGSAHDALFADNTLGAIRQGAEHALAALIERTVNTMRQELGQAPRLLVTGGASSRLLHALHRPHEVVPDLVVRGLAVLAVSSAAP